MKVTFHYKSIPLKLDSRGYTEEYKTYKSLVYALYGKRLDGGYQICIPVGYIGREQGKYKLANMYEYYKHTDCGELDLKEEHLQKFEEVLKTISSKQKGRLPDSLNTIEIEVISSQSNKSLKEYKVTGYFINSNRQKVDINTTLISTSKNDLKEHFLYSFKIDNLKIEEA